MMASGEAPETFDEAIDSQSSDSLPRLDTRPGSSPLAPDAKKPSWRNRLKGKIFTKTNTSDPTSPGARAPSSPGSSKPRLSTADDDIKAFLKTGNGNGAQKTSSPTSPGRPTGPPRLSTAAPTGTAGANVKFVFHKKRRRPGLVVGFVPTKPEIIGIGGEDAIDPVVAISRLLKQARIEGRTGAGAQHFLPEPAEEVIERHPFRKRRPTGPADRSQFPVIKLDEPYSQDAVSSTDDDDDDQLGGFQSEPPASSRRAQPDRPTIFTNLPEITTDDESSTEGPPGYLTPHDQIYDPSSQREYIRRGSSDGRMARAEQQSGHLAPQAPRGRSGTSPSPARRPHITQGQGQDEIASASRPDSRSSDNSQASAYQTLAPDAFVTHPNASLLSLGSRQQDTTSLKTPPTRSNRAESLPTGQRPNANPQLSLHTSSSNPSGPSSQQAASRPALPDRPSASSITGQDSSFQEFVRRMSHTKQIFELIFQRDTAGSTPSPGSMLRAGFYWFLSGRIGLEDFVRSRQQQGAQQAPAPANTEIELLQHYVNLGKAWWLSTQIDTNPKLSDPQNPASSMINSGMKQSVDYLTSQLQNLTRSMAKRDLLPPEDLLVKGAETTVMLQYPRFSPQTAWILQSVSSGQTVEEQKSLVHPVTALPLGPTQAIEYINAVPVQCSVFSAEDEEQETPYPSGPASEDKTPFPCLVVVLHRSTDQEISLRISSLTHQINVLVRENNQFGPAWEHVRWDQHDSALRIKLPNRLRIRVAFRTKDYGMLAARYRHAPNLAPNASPAALHRRGSSQPANSSQSMLAAGNAAESASAQSDQSQESYLDASMLQIPGPQSLSQRIKHVKVEKVEYYPCEVSALEGAPLFQMDRPYAEAILPNTPSTASSTSAAAPHAVSLQLQSYGCTFKDQIFRSDLANCFRLDTYTPGTEFSILVLRPFELKFSAEHLPPNVTDPRFLDRLQRFQDHIKHVSAISRWTFRDINDLHSFQGMISQSTPQFDGIAKTVSMSRRLPMVPISKTYEAADVRIQVLHFNASSYLACFFDKKYALANALLLPLKRSDIIEVLEPRAKDTPFGIKLVDAKFDLPSDESRKRVEGLFVSLDSEQHPADHEDVILEFANEAERERFMSALPAQVMPSRKFTLRRRI